MVNRIREEEDAREAALLASQGWGAAASGGWVPPQAAQVPPHVAHPPPPPRPGANPLGPEGPPIMAMDMDDAGSEGWDFAASPDPTGPA